MVRCAILQAKRLALLLRHTSGGAIARRRREHVGLHPLPIGIEHFGHGRVIADEGVVGLSANARRRPVGAAGHDRLRIALCVAVDGKLVMADMVVVEQTIGQHDAGVAQPLSEGRVARVPGLRLFIPARIRQNDVDDILGVDDRVAQFVIAKLVEGKPDSAALGLGPFHQAGEHIRNLAVKIGAYLAAGTLKLGPDLIALPDLDAGVFQRARQPLRREHAVGEGEPRLAEHRSQEDGRADGASSEIAERPSRSAIGFLGAHRHRIEAGPHVADRTHPVGDQFAIRPDFDAVAAPPHRKIAPECLLHRPDAGILRNPVLVALPPERHPGRQTAFLAGAGIDADDLEAETAVDHSVNIPGNESNFVVGRRTHADNIRHGNSLPQDGLYSMYLLNMT